MKKYLIVIVVLVMVIGLSSCDRPATKKDFHGLMHIMADFGYSENERGMSREEMHLRITNVIEVSTGHKDLAKDERLDKQ